MKKRTFIVLSIIIVIISGAFSYFHQDLLREHTIIESFENSYSNNVLYGIDALDDYFCIYKIDIQTNEQDFFYIDRIENGESVVVSSVVMNQKGEIYAMISIGDVNYIKICNFDKGKLETAFDVKAINLESIIEYNNTSGNMVCVFYNEGNLEQYEVENGEFNKIGTFDLLNAPSEYVFILCLENDQIWLQSINGDYACMNDDGTITEVFKNDQTQMSLNNSMAIEYAEGIIFKNLDSNEFYKLEYLDGKASLENITDSFKEDFSEVKFAASTYIEEQNIMLTLKNTDDYRLIPSLKGDIELDIDTLDKGFDYFALANNFLCLAFIALTICFAIYKLTNSSKGVSLNVTLASTACVVAVIGIFVLREVLTDKIIVLNDTRMFENSVEINDIIINSFNLEEFENARAKEFITTDDVLKYYVDYYQYDNSYLNNQGEIEPMEIIYNFNLFFYKEDTVYSAQGNILNSDLEYSLNDNLFSSLMEVKETNSDILMYYTPYGTELVATISPIYSSSGELIGAISIEQDFVNHYLVATVLMNEIIDIIIKCIAIILIIVCAIITFSIKDMKKVTFNAYKISQGDFSKINPIKGNNEIVKLNQTLMETVENIKKQSDEMQNLKNKYTAFVPDNLLRDENQYQELKVGQSHDIIAHNVYIKSESANITDAEYSDTNLIDNIEYLIESGIFIDRMLDGEIKAFSLDPNKSIDICLGFLKNAYQENYISITLEEARVGVIGNNNRSSIKAISKYDKFATEISNIANEYKIPLIVSAEASLKIKNFTEDYVTRKIAYIYVESQDKIETLYEIIYANEQQIARKKDDSKPIFEQGLEYYVAGNIEGAMRRFMRVYRENPQDLLAREYIYRCKNRASDSTINYHFLDI
ncbi:MAG: hypothetical protein R3Y09_08890 [Clostridia bacterium]